jgi:hypothetical protein
LLGYYADERTRWAVLEGFTESSPARAKSTLLHYREWCQEQGKPPHEIDEMELERYLKQNGHVDTGEDWWEQ